MKDQNFSDPGTPLIDKFDTPLIYYNSYILYNEITYLLNYLL